MHSVFPNLNYNKLLNNVNGLQLFQVLRFGSFFLTGILLAKGRVNMETIGVYESLMFLSGALSFFWVNALLNSLLIVYPSHSEKKKYLFNVAVLISLFSVGIFMVMRLAEPFIVSFFSTSTLPYFTLFSYFILLNNPCFLIEYIYLVHQKPKQLLWYGLISFTAAILMN